MNITVSEQTWTAVNWNVMRPVEAVPVCYWIKISATAVSKRLLIPSALQVVEVYIATARTVVIAHHQSSSPAACHVISIHVCLTELFLFKKLNSLRRFWNNSGYILPLKQHISKSGITQQHITIISVLGSDIIFFIFFVLMVKCRSRVTYQNWPIFTYSKPSIWHATLTSLEWKSSWETVPHAPLT